MTKNLRELEQLQQNLEYQKHELKVFIADVIPNDTIGEENVKKRMIELENLVQTFGGIIIVKHIQKRGFPDYNTYIGSGKLDEIIEEMQENEADLLIIGNILKPHQIYKINEKLKKIKAKAWDRVDLILKIFERNAKTTESRLQIELASIKHMGPRIFDMGMELGSQGSGGSKLSRGKGETNTEIMKRHLERRIASIKKDLEHYKKVRETHRNARIKKGLNTVGIVGYTNAGKSSLMNVLTGKGVLSEDKLFATLGTSVGKMVVLQDNEIKEGENFEYQKPKEILINDTIGFIKDLPPNLIEAFSSTLEDSIESDLLVHLIDASDPQFEEKIKIVDDILNDIKANQERIYVFNKIDLLSQEKLAFIKEKFTGNNDVFISTYSLNGIDNLKNILSDKLF